MAQGLCWAMPMGMTTPMHTEAPRSPLLALMWLASPALPIGGFSYSEGLEAAVAHGLVHDAASTTRWLQAQLMLTQARGDLAALAALMQAWREPDTATREARVAALNAWVHQTRESAELRLQTEQMGRSLLQWLAQRGWASEADLACGHRLGPTYPMVMALALARSGAELREALSTHAFAWCENMVQAAIKSVPLGQSAGQAVLAELSRHIDAAVDEALSRNDHRRQSFSPMLAVLSARHETQYSRLFRS